MNVVIRLKDERRLIMKDAKGLFQTNGMQEDFKKGDIVVNAWDLTGFEMEKLEGKLRVLKFIETNEKTQEKIVVWVVMDLLETNYKTIWTMMHRRWDIELNGFHQLKTYYHAEHCYCHEGFENIFLLKILDFNIRELYLFRRKKGFRDSKMSRREITIQLQDELLIEDMRKLFVDDG